MESDEKKTGKPIAYHMRGGANALVVEEMVNSNLQNETKNGYYTDF